MKLPALGYARYPLAVSIHPINEVALQIVNSWARFRLKLPYRFETIPVLARFQRKNEIETRYALKVLIAFIFPEIEDKWIPETIALTTCPRMLSSA